MERTDILALMGELKLYGMRAAFDEVMATGIKRQHEPPRIVGDLLKADKPACFLRILILSRVSRDLQIFSSAAALAMKASTSSSDISVNAPASPISTCCRGRPCPRSRSATAAETRADADAFRLPTISASAPIAAGVCFLASLSRCLLIGGNSRAPVRICFVPRLKLGCRAARFFPCFPVNYRFGDGLWEFNGLRGLFWLLGLRLLDGSGLLAPVIRSLRHAQRVPRRFLRLRCSSAAAFCARFFAHVTRLFRAVLRWHCSKSRDQADRDLRSRHASRICRSAGPAPGTASPNA